MITGPAPSPVGAIGSDPGAAPVRLLADEDPLEGRKTEAPEGFGHVPGFIRPSACAFATSSAACVCCSSYSAALRPDLLLGELARELPEAALLLGEGERDARADSTLDRGHAQLLLDVD